MRWYVERQPHVFEDVGAPHCDISDSGALVFRDAALRIVLAYASGQWITVHPGDDDE